MIFSRTILAPFFCRAHAVHARILHVGAVLVPRWRQQCHEYDLPHDDSIPGYGSLKDAQDGRRRSGCGSRSAVLPGLKGCMGKALAELPGCRSLLCAHCRCLSSARLVHLGSTKRCRCPAGMLETGDHVRVEWMGDVGVDVRCGLETGLSAGLALFQGLASCQKSISRADSPGVHLSSRVLHAGRCDGRADHLAALRSSSTPVAN